MRILSDGSTQSIDGSIQHPAKGDSGKTTKTQLLTSAVESLILAKEILDEVFKDQPSDARVKILGAARELAELGNVKMCDVEWCESPYPGHHEHCGGQTISSGTGIEHIEVSAGVDLHGDYDDEIGFRAWFRDEEAYDSVTVQLTVDQAREVVAAIELAIERRAELRGVK